MSAMPLSFRCRAAARYARFSRYSSFTFFARYRSISNCSVNSLMERILPNMTQPKTTSAVLGAPQSALRHLGSILQFPFVRLRRSYRRSVLPTLAHEIRNAAGHIEWSLDISAMERLQGSDKVHVWNRAGLNLGSQSDKYGGTDYTQQIAKHFPFLSVFDLNLILDAWNAGWVFRDREGKLHSQENTSPSENSFRKDSTQ